MSTGPFVAGILTASLTEPGYANLWGLPRQRSLSETEPPEPRERGNRLTRVPAGRRSKWAVLAVWAVALVLCGSASGRLHQVSHDDLLSYLPRDAQSTQAYRVAQLYGDADLSPALVTYERVGGLTSADRREIATDAADAPVSYSPDGRAAQFAVLLNGDDPHLGDRVRQLRAAVQPVTPAQTGLDIHVGGPAGQSADSFGVFDTIDGPLMYLTLGVVMVLLLLTYRSPVLWIIPLLAAVAGLAVAQEAATLLAEHAGLAVNGLSQGIMLVLTVGAGVDYALLLVSRYREELTRYRDKHDAMAVALRNAGPAIVASAGTVVVSLLCLLLSVLNSDRSLGPVAGLGILGAFASMVTLLPALLVALPRHTFWPQVPHFSKTPDPRDSLWGGVARWVAARPRLTWVSATLLLLALATGLLGLRSSGLSSADAFRSKPDSILAQDTLDRHFPADPGNLALVVGDASASAAISAAIAADPRTVPDGAPPRILGTHVRFDVVLADTPDSPAAQRTVGRLRSALAAIPGAEARVGGFAAIDLDILDASRYDRDVVIPAVLLVVLLVLIVMLRSLVAPLMLMATVVLSFGAALGASWLVFVHCLGFHGTDVSYPLFSFVFLVALGIDYNIFLTTRIQEESRRLGTREGTIRGVTVTGGVITSAGVVLAATFSVLATLPLVSLTEIGFTVAFGVLLDTLLVRSMLVPALAVALGDRLWWPSRIGPADSGPAAAQSSQPGRARPDSYASTTS